MYPTDVRIKSYSRNSSTLFCIE